MPVNTISCENVSLIPAVLLIGFVLLQYDDWTFFYFMIFLFFLLLKIIYVGSLSLICGKQ